MVMIQNALALIVYSFMHFYTSRPIIFQKSCLHTTLKASILNPFLKLTAIFATFSQSVIHLKLLQSQQIACHLTHKAQQGFPLKSFATDLFGTSHISYPHTTKF